MPQISQQVLDSYTKALESAEKKIKELEILKKENRIVIPNEVITNIVVTELKPVFEKFGENTDKFFKKYLEEIKNLELITPPPEIKEIENIFSKSIKDNNKLQDIFEKSLKEIKTILLNKKDNNDVSVSFDNSFTKLVKTIKEIKIEPVITVQPQDIKFPEMKDIVFPVQPTLYRVGKDLVEVSRDTPLPVILTDDKGGFYKAVMTAIGGGGGGIQRISTAVVHGTNPTSISSGDTGLLLTNTAGVPFVIGGHPNIQTIRANYAIAQTDTAIVTIAAGLKIVVTRISITASNANTVSVSAVAGFGLVNTPATTGVLIAHPGIAAGSGVVEGTGAGMLGVGADGEDLRITSSAPTTGSIDVVVSYYTINS